MILKVKRHFKAEIPFAKGVKYIFENSVKNDLWKQADRGGKNTLKEQTNNKLEKKGKFRIARKTDNYYSCCSGMNFLNKDKGGVEKSDLGNKKETL